MNGLVFQDSPIFELGTNLFIDVPVVLQYEDTPLIQVMREVKLGYQIKIPIFHNDGTKLAVVKGNQIYRTEAGKKAGVELRRPAGKTVCELAGRPVFEIARAEAAALKTQAELYTPDGAFVRCTNTDVLGHVLSDQRKPLTIGDVAMMNMSIADSPIGILVRRTGRIQLCAGGGKMTVRPGQAGGSIGPSPRK
ncbi:MAG TPA: hypothetical protein VFJ30_09660 [Phycisphaerae bacterium]|nr:hypothetical protein [Phycisphaerae bacterium]